MVEDTAKRDLDLQRHLTTGKNPRGIPTVKFIVSAPHRPSAETGCVHTYVRGPLAPCLLGKFLRVFPGRLIAIFGLSSWSLPC
jgi:hypothetical protein